MGLVEIDGGIGQGMDKEHSDADDFRDLDRAEDGVSQQCFAYALSLPPAVDGEASEDHGRYGIGHVAPDSPCGLLAHDGGGCQAVVGHYLVVGTKDVSAGSATALVTQGAVF